MVCIPLEIIKMKKLMNIIQKSIEWVSTRSIFQKFVFIGLFLVTSQAKAQYVQIATHYDAESTAHHIIHGHVKGYLNDSVRFVTEKKTEHYLIKEGMSPEFVKGRLDKVFAKGKLEYVSRTNGGYMFTIAVVNASDDTKVINYCTFHVNAYTQKITEVEILLGE